MLVLRWMGYIIYCWKRSFAPIYKRNKQELLETHLICPLSLVSTTNTDFVESYRLLRETSLPDFAKARKKHKTLNSYLNEILLLVNTFPIQGMSLRCAEALLSFFDTGSERVTYRCYGRRKVGSESITIAR